MSNSSVPSTKIIVLQLNDTNEPSSKNNKFLFGFHLTKTIWDAYPWVGFVEHESVANRAGLRPGDILLGIDGTDVVGLKIKYIADLINEREDKNNVKLRIWRHEPHISEDEKIGTAWSNKPLPDIIIRFTDVFSATLRCLECPICLEATTPPISQCVNGHILCFKCRPKTSRCPVCRVRLGQGRCLIAEKIWKVIFDIFDTNNEMEKYTKATHKTIVERLFCRLSTPNITKTNQKNINVPSKPKQSLLAKLFLGGVEKAASTENLATVSQINDKLSRLELNNICNGNNLERLTLNDRQKSASTSELSLEKVDCEMDKKHELQTNITVQTRPLNLDLDLILGGFNSLVFSKKLSCPFYIQKNCEIVLTIIKLMDHLIICHSSKIIHTRGGRIKLPIPSFYGPDDVFLMHYMNNMFILQVENGLVWMIDVLGNNMNLKWTLTATGNSNTEVICTREMTKLEYPMVRLSKDIVFLPEILGIDTIDVKIIGNESELGICKTNLKKVSIFIIF
ncbi:hypothetical protein M0802_000256 [Mischocyttarus mexicanus]|nr:hypothetical protein M0802_000256 [Mischocyttarus mexicanus]